MAIAALVLWICTVGIGSYLLLTATRIGKAEPAQAEAVPVPAGQTAQANGGPAAAASPASPASPQAIPVDPKDPFAPLSLQLDREAPPPGLKELAEFAHPALGIIGMAFWVGYVISRNNIMLAIGLGILLGAIAAGVSWFIVNGRAAKRARAGDSRAGDSRPGDSGPGDTGTADAGADEDLTIAPLSFTPLVLILHTAGAALTLLIVVLIVAHV